MAENGSMIPKKLTGRIFRYMGQLYIFTSEDKKSVLVKYLDPTLDGEGSRWDKKEARLQFNVDDRFGWVLVPKKEETLWRFRLGRWRI